MSNGSSQKINNLALGTAGSIIKHYQFKDLDEHLTALKKAATTVGSILQDDRPAISTNENLGLASNPGPSVNQSPVRLGDPNVIIGGYPQDELYAWAEGHVGRPDHMQHNEECPFCEVRVVPSKKS